MMFCFCFSSAGLLQLARFLISGRFQNFESCRSIAEILIFQLKRLNFYGNFFMYEIVKCYTFKARRTCRQVYILLSI